MPTLKQLTCTVEWTGSNIPLQEFQTTYGDGFVEAFIAVPPIQTPFSIHLTSHGYIAPGLAMFVWMDGDYQCNRNRTDLVIPDGTTKPLQTDINFRVRQKEIKQPDGNFCGQQWKFRELNIVPDVDTSLASPTPFGADHVGTIEVVVLRCLPSPCEKKAVLKLRARSSNLKGASKAVSKVTPEVSSDSSSDDSSDDDSSKSGIGGLFDGAGDSPPMKARALPFGGDGAGDQDQGWGNQGQGSWNPTRNSQEWGGGKDNNTGNTSGNGWDSTPAKGPESEWDSAPAKTQDARWGTRRSSTSDHFSKDWNAPSQAGGSQAGEAAPQERSNRHGSQVSRRSIRTSSAQQNSPAPETNIAWGANAPAQPSPAIVINVNHSPAPQGYGPLSIPDSWKERPLPAHFAQAETHVNSPNGSNHSGSNKSGSNKSSGSQNKNSGGKGWQAKGGQTQDWGKEAQAVPGAWNTSNDKPEEASNWKNGNSGGDAAWGGEWNTSGQYGGLQDNTGNDTSWNNNDQNAGWQDETVAKADVQNNVDGNAWNTNDQNGGGQDQTGKGSNEHGQGYPWAQEVLNAYPDWASPTQPGKNPSKQQSPQQNNWPNSTTVGNEPQQQAWGTSGNDPVQDEPIGLFGRVPVPASESAKEEDFLKSKHSKLGRPPTTGPLHSAGAVPSSSRGKFYWPLWNLPIDEEPEIEEEPEKEPAPGEGLVYSVPAEVAMRNSVSHQVQAGRSAVYVHRQENPEYMDSHDSPYASFTFRYRSRGVIEKMFNVSLAETEEEEKERLSSLSKEELIEHYLKAKASASSQKSSSGSNGSKKQDHMTSGGLGFTGELANKLSQLNVNKSPSDRVSTDPSVTWGRPAKSGNGFNHAATASNANVAGWLSNGGGGNAGSPPKENSGGSKESNNGQGAWDKGQTNSGNAWETNAGQADTGADQKQNEWDAGGNSNQIGTSWNNAGGDNDTWNGGGGNDSGAANKAAVEW